MRVRISEWIADWPIANPNRPSAINRQSPIVNRNRQSSLVNGNRHSPIATRQLFYVCEAFDVGDGELEVRLSLELVLLELIGSGPRAVEKEKWRNLLLTKANRR